MLLALTLPTLVLGEPWEDCRAEMSSACLADLAVTDAKIGTRALHRSRYLELLLNLGKDAEAAELIRQSVEAEGYPPEQAAHEADAQLAAGRLAQSIRSGMPAALRQ